MGFLSIGDTLTWEESKKYIDYIRKHGIIQFISIFKRNCKRSGDKMLWGDEIEYIMIKFNNKEKKVELNLRANEILDDLIKEEESTPFELRIVSWKPEYGRYMIEATPGGPYGEELDSFFKVEDNMQLRRRIVESRLKPDESIITLTHFPMIGVGSINVRGPISNSLFVSDDLINKHHRFSTLTKNIRDRKDQNIAINVPLFMDKNTQSLTYENYFLGIDSSKIPALKNHVYADAMIFGMGQCCLQTTFSLPNIEEARYMYDQLVALTPIMLALSAATPILRGYLTDADVRWNIISSSVDDRTVEELGQMPLKNNRYVIDKSRYASISSYLSNNDRFKPEYNDVPLIMDEEIYKQLINEGVDHLLAQHVAHLFIRDPLVIYNDRIQIDDENDADHFENIQSTNWQTLRFKPPPANSNIGWRVEFRPIEANITDFENAAFATIIFLWTRVIKSFDLNMYMPLSKVDENMQTAHKRGAVTNERFWFRTDISGNSKDKYELMSINNIINGSPSFVGILPLLRKFISSINMDYQHKSKLEKYFMLIECRANGTLKTTATWIRDFIRSHPDYKFDSIVPHSVAYDLCSTVSLIEKGLKKEPSLLGDLYTVLKSKL